MLMMGRLMFGKRSIGSRPSATNPSSAIASDAIRTAIALRRARNVSHMLFLHLDAHLLALPHELLAFHDHRLVAGEATDDLDEGAVADTGGDRTPPAHAVLDDEHGDDGALGPDRLVRHEAGAQAAVDHELDTAVHAGLAEELAGGAPPLLAA